ncbi:protein of unknown function (plasmid) [Rhodovastum atsumiense]|nr:protein of unknown function [Rhodovastum atsumiense]
MRPEVKMHQIQFAAHNSTLELHPLIIFQN